MKPSKTELKRNITQAMIREHGEGLIRFFKLDPFKTDPIDLCKKLRRLENKAHQITTQMCNGYLKEEVKLFEIEEKVKALLDPHKYPLIKKQINAVFINHDPRGYALKLDDETVKYYEELGEYFPHKDWGGYGIIAPDLTSDIENEVDYISRNWKSLDHDFVCRSQERGWF